MEPGEAWGLVGLGCYLGAATLFAIGVGSLVPGNETVVRADPLIGAVLLVASGMLLIIGTFGLRRASEGRDAEPPGHTGRSDDAVGTVRCDHCGTENDANYRFCASCANAL